MEPGPVTCAHHSHNKITMQTGWPLWKLFLSMSFLVVLGSIGGDLIRGRAPQIDADTFWLWVFTPGLVVLSTILHEYIHAYTAKYLLEGTEIRIKFSAFGGATHAMVNENAALWRKLTCSLSPAIICAVLGLLGMMLGIIVGAFVPEPWKAMAVGFGTAHLMVAGVNLFNLLPFGSLDGGQALKETISSGKEFWRSRRSTAPAAL